MTLVKSATTGVPVTLQDAATTGNGREIAVPTSFKNHRFNIKTPAGVTAGKVQCESADIVGYAGTWAAIGAEVTLVAGAELEVRLAGILSAVRCRITTTVSGGGAPSVSATYTGY